MGVFDAVRDVLGGDGSSGDDENGADDEPPTDAADALVEAAAEQGFDLDYTPASLRQVDALIRVLPEEERGRIARLVSAYLGAVFVRNYDCTWVDVGDAGWAVDFAAVSDDEETLFSLAHATKGALEGETTLARAHNEVVSGLYAEAPTLDETPADLDAGAEGDDEAESTAAADESHHASDGDADAEEERPLDVEAAEAYRERADELANGPHDHDLDFSPASLGDLDDFVAVNYDTADDDVDREERVAESPPGEVPQDADLRVGSGSRTAPIVAYLGEVFRRSYDGTWWEKGAFDVVVVETDAGRLEVEPELLVAAALPGYVSFERYHDDVAEEFGLDEA